MESGSELSRFLPNGWGWDNEGTPAVSLNWLPKTQKDGQFEIDNMNHHRGWVWSNKSGRWHPAKYGTKPKEEKPITEIAGIPLITVPTPESVERDLRAWWETTSEHDLEETVPKAVAYGTESMVEFGRTIGRLAGRKLTETEALEWAIFAYMQGKMGRWLAALQRGERCDGDTLKDLTVYSNMARKVRETGMWT